MKLLCIHAHYDDFEFVAGGTFALFRERYRDQLETKLIVCTDGAAGHHEMGLEETRERRWLEQQKAAGLGGHHVERLRLPDGSFRMEVNPVVDRPFLAALWRAIREFEPDYLFCPPVPEDPLAGIHLDHVAVASAVRQVAYMINVPHAFVDLYPDLPQQPISCRVPVILNTYDPYMLGSNPFDFVIGIESVFDLVCDMAWCHQSQVCEWLPWVGRHKMDVPKSLDDWQRIMRDRYLRQSRELGLEQHPAVEAFLISAWGEIPTPEKLKRDFPGIIDAVSTMSNLRRRLAAMG